MCTCLQRFLFCVILKCLREVHRLLVPGTPVHRDRDSTVIQMTSAEDALCGVAAERSEVGEICGGVSRDLQPDELA